MQDPHINDVESQPTGPLEPLPGHDVLLLPDPAPIPSVPAPVPTQPRRAVAMKRSGKLAHAIADEDDDSDEEDDDYAPPSAKARRTNESEDLADAVSSVVNSPEPAGPTSTVTVVGADPPVSGGLALPGTVIVKRRKTMDDNVGPRFQADVPDLPLPPEERGKDRRAELAGELQWEPTASISDEHLSRYLLALDGAEDSLSVEKALNLLRLRHCDYKSVTLDVLYGPPGLDLQRRRRRDILNKEEQKQFKEAMTVLGKDFHLIAKCMHRSVHELIDYYYLWKKQRKFHASVAHLPYSFYVDPTIRLPRLAENERDAAGGATQSEESEEEGSSSESSASCKQS